MQIFRQGFTPIQGFEATDYVYLGERIVWIGDDASVRHPRNFWQAWQAPKKTYAPALLRAGAALALKNIDQLQPSSLLNWLATQQLSFALKGAKQRLELFRHSLQTEDAFGFSSASHSLLGLGEGLTPSGDDLLGGFFFALHYLPAAPSKKVDAWRAHLGKLAPELLAAAARATNPISAALLADSMAGQSYAQLHDMLDALASNDAQYIDSAAKALQSLGANSGSDLLAGLLLALTHL